MTPIEESTGYLIVQLCRAHRNKAQALLAGIGLYPGQEFLLLTLFAEDGIVQTDLADRLGVKPATLTRMLDRMERNEFVERRPDPADQRVSRVFLTPAGAALEAPIRTTWAELDALSFAHLTTEERLLLRRLLLQVVDDLA